MRTYINKEEGNVLIRDDGASIPKDLKNRDYQQALKEVEEGKSQIVDEE